MTDKAPRNSLPIIPGAAVFLLLVSTTMGIASAQHTVRQDQQARETAELSTRVAELKVKFLQEAQLYSPHHPVLKQHLQELAALTAILEKKPRVVSPPLPPMPPQAAINPEIQVIIDPVRATPPTPLLLPGVQTPRQSPGRAKKLEQQLLARQKREVDRLAEQVAQAKREVAELKQQRARQQARSSPPATNQESDPSTRPRRAQRAEPARPARPAPRVAGPNVGHGRRIQQLEDDLDQIKSILVRLLDIIDRAVELEQRD